MAPSLPHHSPSLQGRRRVGIVDSLPRLPGRAGPHELDTTIVITPPKGVHEPAGKPQTFQRVHSWMPSCMQTGAAWLPMLLVTLLSAIARRDHKRFYSVAIQYSRNSMACI